MKQVVSFLRCFTIHVCLVLHHVSPGSSLLHHSCFFGASPCKSRFFIASPCESRFFIASSLVLHHVSPVSSLLHHVSPRFFIISPSCFFCAKQVMFMCFDNLFLAAGITKLDLWCSTEITQCTLIMCLSLL